MDSGKVSQDLLFFQNKSISLFLPQVTQCFSPVRSWALRANDGQTLSAKKKKKNNPCRSLKTSKKRSWSQARRVRRAQNHFLAVTCREGELEGNSSLCSPGCPWTSPPLEEFPSEQLWKSELCTQILKVRLYKGA